jgi:hypothetical protein
MGLTRGNVVDARVLRAPAAQINVHEMPGGHSIQQLHEALHVTLDAERQEDGLRVDVTLENRGAGHAVPTGMPGRRILLELEVRTGDGRTYTEERTYAKQFVDNLNRPIAHVADLFGDDVKLARDTRIGVDEVRSESWTFDVPANSLAWVEAKLHYEHTPRGKDEDSTFLTFFSEKRTVRRAQAED